MGETFQSRLNQALEIRGMKPVELAQRTGLSKARISQYTNGVYEAKQKSTLFDCPGIRCFGSLVDGA